MGNRGFLMSEEKNLTILNKKDLEIVSKNKERAVSVNRVTAAIREMETSLDDWEKDLYFAAYLKKLKEDITDDQIDLLKTYQNNRFGFQTDRPGGYDNSVLKNIFIEALALGVRVRGNEFNIIGGNLYVTKLGIARLLDELIEKNNYDVKGRDNPKIVLNNTTGNYNLCYEIIVKDQYGNIVLEVKKDIPVPGKAGKGEKQYALGIDAIQGKGQRKLDNYLYSKLSKRKTALPEGEFDDVDLPSTPQITKNSTKITIDTIPTEEKSENSNDE